MHEQVFAAAAGGNDRVGEAFLRAVLGDAGWEGLPEHVKQVFIANGPAILAEERGGLLDVSVEQLAELALPTLVVGARTLDRSSPR